ncbi:MAG: hypothetical protein ACPG47_03425 [Leucothrix sp.]
MLRYLPGLLLLQLATFGIGLIIGRPEEIKIWFIALFAMGVLGVFAAFWFVSLARSETKDAVNKVRLELQEDANQAKMALQEEVNKTKLDFAKERENLHVRAEKAKTKLVEKTQKQIASEYKKTHGKANLKVGAAFAVTVGAGILMLFIELLTFGLMTLTTAGGALGGYLVRARKAHQELKSRLPNNNNDSVKVLAKETIEVVSKDVTEQKGIEAEEVVIKNPKKLKLPTSNILKRNKRVEE